MSDPEKLYASLVDAFRGQRWSEAHALAQQLMPQASKHAGVHGIAGVACLELGQPDEAAGYLRRASELDPARADFATLHAKAACALGSHGEAMGAVDRALALHPSDPMTLDTLGIVCVRMQSHEKAALAFRRAVALAPDHAPFRFNLATALIGLGDVEAAEIELERCIALAPRYWNPHLALAQLRRQTPERNHLTRLLPLLEGNSTDPGARTYLNMALSKEFDDLGEHSRAYAHLVQAKASARLRVRYRAEEDEVLFSQLMQSFPDRPPAPAGDPSEEPIFVVGMPRSGTTLVERILSCHPQVHGAGELQNFANTLQRISGHRGSFIADPQAMADIERLDWKALGAGYISSTRPGTGHTPRFVDKLPHNFLFIGFIARALPNAKIVCLRRDPVDTCLSNFRQLFEPDAAHFGYSFDLLDTGRYYLLFDRLMRHWKRIFPGRILELQYENLVADQESATRQLLDFCGLSWNDACLQFHENTAPVATLSAAQVRRPIYGSSVGHWRRYAAHLGPLLELLHAGGIEVDLPGSPGSPGRRQPYSPG
jgi:Flp pilus assembly protein TadD